MVSATQYKLHRRGDLMCVVDADTFRPLSGHADRAAAMDEIKTLVGTQGDQADCSGIHQVVCIDAECERLFVGFDQMKDHADAVHTFSDIEELVRDAVREKYNQDGDRQAVPPIPYRYAWVRDLAADWVVYEVNQSDVRREKNSLFQASYSITDGVVTLGEPTEVVRKTVYEPVKQEATS